MIHSYFYPRSPCGERLAEVDGEDTSSGDFYPRSPCGERPTITGIIYSDRKISIHALLAESDQQSRGSYIRTEKFLSTLSLRRATVQHRLRLVLQKISIHALLAESDTSCANKRLLQPLFLSTLSLRRATCWRATVALSSRNFYPRSPCGERPSVSDSV